jgi:hypothetical protein
MYLYADDAKIGKTVVKVEDCISLQKDLDNIIHWGTTWGLTFSPNKCKCMSFCYSKNKQIINYTYVMDGTDIQKVNQFTDLGLVVTNNLSWDNHINTCIKKANQRLGFVKRTIGYSCSVEVKLMSYKSLIRPIVEYCSILWSGGTKKQLLKVESLQRRASKFISNDNYSCYEHRLRSCDILPLSLRREMLDCTFFYNCIHGITDYDILSILQMHVPSSVTRNDDEYLLSANKVKSETYSRFFTNRVRHLWNVLPYGVRSCDLTPLGYNSEFKTKLKEYFNKYFIDKFISTNTCTWSIKCTCFLCRSH